MSVHVMSRVWRGGPSRQGALLVLLAIADFADDNGYAWPSVRSIAEKARMTERGVQKVIRELQKQGWLTIETGGGRGGSNRYKVMENPEQETVNTVRGEQETPNTDAKTPNNDAETLNGGSPNPSRTIKEPSESKKARAIIAEVLGDELTDAFLKSRRALRKPLTTEHAAKLFVAELSKCRDPVAATNKAILKGWQTVYPENGNGKPSKQSERAHAFVAGARGAS